MSAAEIQTGEKMFQSTKTCEKDVSLITILYDKMVPARVRGQNMEKLKVVTDCNSGWELWTILMRTRQAIAAKGKY
jgi:hypothetical protein